MKKFAAIVLALLLCASLALAETVDVTGTWYLNLVVSGEVSVNPAVMGMDMVITLNADGTATGDVMGETGAGTWAMDGQNVVVTLEGDPMTFILQDGNLVADTDGTTQMIFGREKAEVETWVLADVNPDATMADYNGSWNATVVDMMGMQFPVADLGMSMVITVADGVATLTEGVGEEAETTEGTATVENGVLSIISSEDSEPLTLQLRMDGMMTYIETSEDGSSMGIYFEKVVEAE